MEFIGRKIVLFAVDRAARGCKEDFFTPWRTLASSQREDAEDVHRGVEHRIRDGPPDVHLRCVMTDNIETTFPKKLFHEGGVAGGPAGGIPRAD